MEVVVALPPPPSPLPSMDFNFDSNCSSPYITAPSSPQRFANLFFSAPATPTRNSVSSLIPHSSVSSSSPLDETISDNTDSNEDFEFDFGGNLQRPSLSAEELFQGGKIRPLELTSSQTTDKESSSMKVIQERAVTIRKRVEEGASQPQQQHKRGRERASSFSIPSSTPPSSLCHRENGRRSLSRVSESSRHESHDVSPERDNSNNKGFPSPKAAETASTFSSFLSSLSFSKGYRKWRIKDFLLFRSASEGRATEKDHLRKYTVLAKTTAYEDVSNSSFRSVESSGSVSRRRGPVSAHELHYTLNRAATEELKKKTLLPYKQGLLGCLGFNQSMPQLSGRFGSLERS